MGERIADADRVTNGLKLVLLGFAILFLELALIRYLAATIWNLGYFPNLVLLAAFLGMGVGFIFHHHLSDRGSRVCFQLAFVVLMALVLFVHFFHPSLPQVDGSQSELAGELYFIYAPTDGEDTKVLPFAFCFVSIIAVFALLSQRMAKLFRLFKPLTAYTLDITGSCLGICAFMAISFFQLPPTIWFAVFAGVFLVVTPGSWKTRWIPLLPALVVCGIAHNFDTHPVRYPDFHGELAACWSPYQRLDYVDGPDLAPNLRRTIWSNGMGHQRIGAIDEIRKGFYSIPYVDRTSRGLPPYRNELIIGAGSGNDTAVALANGVASIDAVEIDPAIAELGRRYHPAHPYDDPRVRLTVDDGRAFMAGAEKRYDLIVFAWADSLVRDSSQSQLRLENYLFTEESIRRAYSLLSDRGSLYIFNSFPHPWVGEKFASMIYSATGSYPMVMSNRIDDFAFLRVDRFETNAPPAGIPLTADYPTDDWPFLHLRARAIPPFYLKVLVGMGLFVGLLILAMHVLTRGQGLYGEARTLYIKTAFVFMGIAFMLLETKSVIQFSLLFGTTWLTNSLVFLAVLALILAANWTASAMKGGQRLTLIFPLLIVSCLVPLFYPLGNLLALRSELLRFAIASLLTFSPIYFANLIFSVTFRDQQIPEHIFGWNLIGATVGGLLEYTSMALGYNRLSLIVALCYVIVVALIVRSGKEPAAR